MAKKLRRNKTKGDLDRKLKEVGFTLPPKPVKTPYITRIPPVKPKLFDSRPTHIRQSEILKNIRSTNPEDRLSALENLFDLIPEHIREFSSGLQRLSKDSDPKVRRLATVRIKLLKRQNKRTKKYVFSKEVESRWDEGTVAWLRKQFK